MLNKRILSLLLAIVLVVGLMPTSVFATETEGTTAPTESVPETTGEAIEPQNEEDPTPCDICNVVDCGVEHKYCEKCEKYDCGKPHVICEVCKVEDCGVEHEQCDLCGAYDCNGEHEYCTECEKYNCGQNHDMPCETCGTVNCPGHNETVPTIPTLPTEPEGEEETEEGEEKQCTCTPAEDGTHSIECALSPDYQEIYASIMASDSFDAVYQMIVAMKESEAEAFYNSLTEDEANALVDHMLTLLDSANICATKAESIVVESTEVIGEVERVETPPVTNGYTNAAPFKAPVEGASFARFARSFFAAAPSTGHEVDNASVETSKSVSGPVNGVYTISLEAYVTGEMISETITEQIPTDIILVLDQSGSMDNNFDSTFTSYKAYSNSTTNETFYDDGGNVYYKDGESYVPVTIERVVTESNTEVFYGDPTYNGQVSKIHLMYYANRENLVFKGATPEEDIPVDVSIGLFNVTYSAEDGYTFPDGTTSKSVTIIPLLGLLGEPNDYLKENLKIKTVDTVAEYQYTYTYATSDGVVHTLTSDGNDGTVCSDENVTFYYGETTTQSGSRLNALKTAVNQFADSVHSKAKGADNTAGTSDDINHRIAVVGFASGRVWQGTTYNYGNTELFVGGTQYAYNAGRENDPTHEDSAQSHYDSAFQDMNTTSGYNNVIASKNALDADGGTLINLGIEMANGIFEENPIPSGQKRNRVVIVFTDGVPGWSGYDSTVASSAISEASTAKGTNGATVYSVGIFNGADANSAGSNGNNATETQKANWFMQNLSSNNGTVQKPSYYLSAANSTDLSNIFQEISQNIQSGGAGTTLDSTTVVKDIISDYFTLPTVNGAIDSAGIKVYTSDYTAANTFTGKDVFACTVNVSEDGKTISVSNFDFSENWCGTETVNGKPSYRGKKLIIEIPVTPNADFLGGNGVPTNGENAGIYSGDDMVEDFVPPVTDVAIKSITPVAENQSIYLSNPVNLEDLLGEIDERIAGTNNDYVNVWYEIFDGNTLIGTYAIYPDDSSEWIPEEDQNMNPVLEADKTYTLKCTVHPINNGTYGAVPSDAIPATVTVYKPFVTFQDTSVNAGDSANFDGPSEENRNLVKVEWKNAAGEQANANEMGAAPELIYDYDKEEGPLSVETEVKVTSVMANKMEIISGVTFYRDTCTAANGCDHVNDGKPVEEGAVNFIVHIKTFDLKITKSGVEDEDGAAPFIFNVSCKDTGVNMDVVIYGNNSVTIKGLPAGTYTVKEVNGYWRYEIAENDTAEKTVTPSGATASVVFENARTKDKWLDDWAKATNNFG